MSKYKAIKITKDNKRTLEAQFGMAHDYLEFSSGLFVVAGFGDSQYHAILTKAGLEANFIRGKELLNGFFELEKKPIEPVTMIATVAG